MSDALQPVIVGAGPAGVRAAEALVDAGLRPVVIDENARWGGQIYRQPPADGGFARGKRTLYGFEAAKADAVHRMMAALLPHVDYRPNTLAWACGTGRVDTLQDGREITVPYSHLIVASGATDRMLPVPGWTLAGVYTLGGAQVALKAQGCAIGRRIVFAGTGPLLYLVAYQYAKAGAQVAAVLDTSPLRRQAAAAPALLRMPSTFAKGLYYIGWLRAHGVAIETGVTLERVLGEQHVTGLAWRAAGDDAQPRVLDCDALGLGFGLRSETQLADLAGCRFGFDPVNRAWLPSATRPAARRCAAFTSRAMARVSRAPTRPKRRAGARHSRCSTMRASRRHRRRRPANPMRRRWNARSRASARSVRASKRHSRRLSSRSHTAPTTRSCAAARRSTQARCAAASAAALPPNSIG